MNCIYEARALTVREYQYLRNTTDWSKLSDVMVQRGLANSISTICASHSGKLVGAGRIIGDGALYFYIQDVIVVPEFQKHGIGTRIMEHLIHYLSQNSEKNAFVGLMAAKGVMSFYERFGFAPRSTDAQGMYLII